MSSAHARLRVAHVVNEPFGPEGANGVQQMIYCLARAQADLGHPVAVVSREDGAMHVLGDDGELPSASAGLPPEGRPPRGLLGRYFEPELARRLLGWSPALVHFHSVHIPANVALAVYLSACSVPYCVTPHGGLFAAARQRGRVKKALFDLAFERRFLDEALFVHAVSQSEADAIRRQRGHLRVVMVPNGPPPGAADVAADPHALFSQYPQLRGRRVFMFVGRLDSRQKGLDLLIDAFAAAAPPQAALVFVGPDFRGSSRALAARAARRRLQVPLVFTGPAYGIDRANLLAAADVFVHVSRWEGMPLAVLAAAAAGRACLLTDAADPLGQLRRAGAAIVVEGTPSGIEEGVRRAAALPPATLRELGERARRIAASHPQWAGIAATLAAAYAEALATRGVPGGGPKATRRAVGTR